MDTNIKNKLIHLKCKYATEGFLIIGFFGSCARNDDTSQSDIDILYKLNHVFYKKYPGMKAFGRIYDIKNEMTCEFKRSVDIADKDSLNEIGNKFILPQMIYV